MKHRKKLCKRELKRQRKIIVIGLFGLLLCLSFGYAAFSTNINLSAKGNVYKVSDKAYKTSDNGNGTVTITDYDENYGDEINIPQTIKGKKVTKIGERAFHNKEITKVTLPNTLVEIGKYAFSLNNIESLSLPTSIRIIDKYAFAYNRIKYLNLNEGLKSIGLDAFNGNNITEINIPRSVTYMEGGAFANNALTGDEAFIYGINPDGSTNYSILNSYAGKDATGTQLPDLVTKIQDEAYVNVKYDEIIIPRRIEVVPVYCFHASKAKKIIIEEGVKELKPYSLAKLNTDSIFIPSSIEKIETNTFYDNPNLKTINIDRKENAIEGAPWGATNATVNWTGEN